MDLHAQHPFSLILFGASGNLAKLKIYPALYTLALKKKLPEQYAIVGFARTEMTEEEFRKLVDVSVRTDMIEVNEKVLSEFLTHFHYHRGQYDKKDDFDALKKMLLTIEKGWPFDSAQGDKAVRLAYLSIPPTSFKDTLANLAASGVHEKGKGFRCIVEKPVGHDLASFEDIHSTLVESFLEDEIYLLDHYLGKEAIRNIYYLRFSNPVLERLLKNTIIHHVEILASESLGLEGRAGYFENTGTFRDMFQSHLMMMASLLTMRLQDDESNFRDSRTNAVEQIYLPPSTSLDEVIVQGQYGAGKIGREHVGSYLEEEEIHNASRTNTFIAMKLMTRMSRWEGVPFYLKSGKRLDKKETRIAIQFQVPHAVGKGSTPNRIDIIAQGEAGMKIFLQTKVGGTEPSFRPLIMEDPLVCFGECLPEHALLLLEAIHGNQQWFLTFKEVRAAWRLIDPLQSHIGKETTPLSLYAAGSKGPKEADEWIARDGLTWL